MDETTMPATDELLEQYAELSRQHQEIAAPFESQIKALQSARDKATLALKFQMETLESLLKPALVATKRTWKIPYLTAVYNQKDKWDSEILFNIAKEVPAVMSAYEDASFMSFRKTTK